MSNRAIKLLILARPSSPINTQIEMDVTSRQNSLSFESTANYQSTNGIHVQNVSEQIITCVFCVCYYFSILFWSFVLFPLVFFSNLKILSR